MKTLFLIAGILAASPVWGGDLYKPVPQVPLSIDSLRDQMRDAEREPERRPLVPLYDAQGFKGYAVQNPNGSVYIQELHNPHRNQRRLLP